MSRMGHPLTGCLPSEHPVGYQSLVGPTRHIPPPSGTKNIEIKRFRIFFWTKLGLSVKMAQNAPEGPLGLKSLDFLWLSLVRCDFDLSMSQLDTWQKRHVELSRLRIFFCQNSSGLRPGLNKRGSNQGIVCDMSVTCL